MNFRHKYVLAIDQGTTTSRAILFNRQGQVITLSQKTFQQYFPKPGWVEHDPNEIWYTQSLAIKEAMAKADVTDDHIACIGIANQRETTIVWDRETGFPVYNAIVWQDRRTADYCEELKSEGYSDFIQQKTGLVIDAYFSATKVKWILDHVKGIRERAERGELCFGTVDSWLIWKLTRGTQFITDITNASRTMLFNINTMQWDQELLDLFTIPASMLPEVKSSSEVYCETSTPIFKAGIPVSGMAGDQQAALFGQTVGQALAAFLGALVFNLGLTALGSTLAAGLVLAVEGKWDRRLWKALALYWLFLLSWIPITFGSFVKKTTVWEEIRHTRNVAPEAMVR